jgi:zinc protease
MIMPNRKQAPPLRPIGRLALPPYQKVVLEKGIPLYLVNMGTQDVFKLEVFFHAGRYHEAKQMAATATARMLKEGSTAHTASEIAEMIESQGGTLATPTNLDAPSFALYGLNKYLDELLPIFTEVVFQPAFPQHELDSYVAEKIQQLNIDLSKNEVVAYRAITEAIFGTRHPYGYNSTPEAYRALERDDLVRHYNDHYLSGNCSIFLSGRINDEMVARVEQAIASRIPEGHSVPLAHEITTSAERDIFIERPKTVQTAIRLARRLFNRHHPDHNGLYVLNTILGGYFGSRLMMNIREDKGYTYNIYSMMDVMNKDGALIIGTEVGHEQAEDTLRQIRLEMERLCHEPVSDGELQMVRNYIMGTLLNYLDGPFNVADMVKSLTTAGLSDGHFGELLRVIEHITPEELLVLAQKYLKPDDYHKVVVGVKNHPF